MRLPLVATGDGPTGIAQIGKWVEAERDVAGRAEYGAWHVVALGQGKPDGGFLVGEDAANHAQFVADNPAPLGIATDHEAVTVKCRMDVAS